MGGGTTLVEALAAGRYAIGTDISELAAFVSQVKTTSLSERDLRLVRSWANNVVDNCTALRSIYLAVYSSNVDPRRPIWS